MRIKNSIFILGLTLSAITFGCGQEKPANMSQAPTPMAKPTQAESPSSLPNEGFKAQLALVDPPAKLRAGQRLGIKVKVKNASNVFWWARGGPNNVRTDNKFYIAAGDRWLKPDGSLLTDMDGRIGIGKDLSPGDETEVELMITAPKDPGNYTLEVDLVQEQVAWFHEKGSPMAQANVTVTK